MWINGVDKSFQEKQGAPEDISGQREELQQPLEDRQAKTTANLKPEVENVRRMMEELMLNTDEGTMTRWKDKAERCTAKEARVSALKAIAEDAEYKAEMAEREAEEANIMFKAVSGLEKVVAREVLHTAQGAATSAKGLANDARYKAAIAAVEASQSWL